MALTVGTDTYETLAAVDAYHSARGNTAWAAVTDDTTREVYIRKATDYVDRNNTFIGEQASSTQRLKWPRKYAEVEGFAIEETAYPWQLGEAVAIVADMFRDGSFDMEGIVTNDTASISKEKVDVIEVAYDTSKRLQGASVPSHVIRLLRPLTRGNGGLVRA